MSLTLFGIEIFVPFRSAEDFCLSEAAVSFVSSTTFFATSLDFATALLEASLTFCAVFFVAEEALLPAFFADVPTFFVADTVFFVADDALLATFAAEIIFFAVDAAIPAPSSDF